MTCKIVVPLLIILVLFPTTSICGDLAPQGNPDDGSGMYTIEDIYKRLEDGTSGDNINGFKEPVLSPAETMHDLNDVMSKAPVKDDTNGAVPGEVLNGKTFWGLKNGNWGLQIGEADGVSDCKETIAKIDAMVEKVNTDCVNYCEESYSSGSNDALRGCQFGCLISNIGMYPRYTAEACEE